MSCEYYGDSKDPYAIVIRSGAKVEDIHFFSSLDSPQQLGLMERPAGYQVKRHFHNEVRRVISLTQEFLWVRAGKCEVRIYNLNEELLFEIHLELNDAILLAKGGHEILMETRCEILELKQGPYLGDNDKTHFGGH